MRKKRGDLMAAAFIMATSAIGPGFLTQTTVFAEKLFYNFAFIILLSIIIDVIAQITIWRALTFSNLKAQSIGNMLLPGLGNVLAIAVVFGGLVFNIGNFAGTGMGLNALLGFSNNLGVVASFFIIAFLFYSDNSLKRLDIAVKVLAFLMLFLIIYMIIFAHIDYVKLIKFSFWPEKFDMKSTITLVGGTVGGYITFAGAQRLIDAGRVGKENQKDVTRSATFGIIFTGFLRYLLFIGTLSVLLTGITLNPDNPTASVFENTFGDYGKRIFGIIIWAASITSVIGATYTSISFLKDFHPWLGKNTKIIALVFILISAGVNLIFGKPVSLLLLAGYINGFILPLGLLIVLLGIQKLPIFNTFRHHIIFKMLSWIIVFVLLYFSIGSLL
ncbi:NRAMP family divalent metal transporter [Lacihabitans sp. LS3-19]|uniref:NRAMP family divalent metal transporter n=1 Tax=Lacihabitans sp. LS3-19 TaxID=2487335 RepID=UPI0020CB9D9A|nr:divalent metal cation transporter [Lacihabitans sp. LS3-19]